MRANCGRWPGDLPRLLIGIALALLCPAALAADPAPAVGAGCRMASGGQLRGLAAVAVWHARTGCGDSTLVWFETPVGGDGAATAWRVDDLLIVPNLERRHSLSLLSPLGVECRHLSDTRSLVIATGEWIPGAARQRADRAWRVEPESRKLAEVPVREVSCVLR